MREEDVVSRAERALDREERETHARSLMGKTERGHLLAWTEAAIQAIPVLGALVPLLREYIPNEQQGRVIELLQNLVRETNRQGVALDSLAIMRRPVAVLLEEALERSARAESDGKRGYYATAFVNTVRQPDLDEEDQARLRGALHAIRPSNLRVFAAIVRSHVAREKGKSREFYDFLVDTFPSVPKDRLRLDVEDLIDLQLIDQGQTYNGVRVSSGRLTEFGERFAAWLSLGEDRSEA